MSVVYDYQVTDMDCRGVCGVAETPGMCETPCTPPLIVVVGHKAQSAAVGGGGS